MELIDNVQKTLGEDLKNELKSGSNVKIIAACFSIYAYKVLKNELERSDKLKFIFPKPMFLDDNIEGIYKKEVKEFYIPKLFDETSIYGSEFEIRLKNQLNQKAIAKECASWIRRKVQFKTNVSGAGLQNFIYITNKNKEIIYTPINAFTTTELGVGDNRMYVQGITKFDDKNYTKMLVAQFDKVWQNENALKDVTNNVINYISSAYKDNSPEYIYFLTLYNIFSEFLDDILSEDYYPNELTGYQNSIIWESLYNFQRDGAIGVINKLEKYNGCILADSVGLGKTFTALAVMKYYASRNKNILVLTPKRLADNWNRYKNNTKTNIFFNDHIRYDVLYHTDLGRVKGFSNGIDLTTFNWNNYDLLVIDESHNFRNANKFKNKETRYDFLINKVIKSGVKTKVLMLSATPVNNRFTDLRNQLALIYGDNVDEFNKKLDTSKATSEILKQAQQTFNNWTKLSKEERKTSELMNTLDIDFSILLDNVSIARSRKHIIKYYDISEVGDFPIRRKPIAYYTDIAKEVEVIGYKPIYDKLMKLTMAVYAPTIYIQPSKREKYADIYDTEVKGKGDLHQVSRERALQRLMTINLLKRLESSVDSFRITCKRIIKINEETLGLIVKFENDEKTSFVTENIRELALIEKEDLDDENFDFGTSTTIGKIKIDLRDMDLILWKHDLERDIKYLEDLYNKMISITPDKDLKLQKLREVIDNKITNPFNEGNRKILIFSAFADTANYLYNNLADYIKIKYNLNSARIQGGIAGNTTNISGKKDTDRLLTLFSPISKGKDIIYPNDNNTIDILIATDCISEGQNLQDCDICINYDIHWNPVRIVQRFGRVDRIGSKNKYVQLVTFWPNIKLDEYINLNKRVESRMYMLDFSGPGGENVLSEEEYELDYRAKQLQQLQNGELQDLEDIDGSITITDLGLNEFRMDIAQYIKEYGMPKNVVNGVYAVVPESKEKGIDKGTIFILRNRNNGINIEKKNRLHPYYLVYILEDGTIKINHMNPKAILDAIRISCKYVKEPIDDLCLKMNIETDDGYKMDKYSNQLKKVVKSIIRQEKQNDLDSLFNKGSQALLNEISGIDDFELITFVVVK